MNQGDLILIPFPFTDLSNQKTRPALIVSKVNRGNDLILVCISKTKHPNSLIISNADLSQGVLPQNSFVRYNKIATLSRSLIHKRIGSLKRDILKIIIQKCKSLF